MVGILFWVRDSFVPFFVFMVPRSRNSITESAFFLGDVVGRPAWEESEIRISFTVHKTAWLIYIYIVSRGFYPVGT